LVRVGVHIVGLTEQTWPALERLFGANGAVGGCWCMFFRMSGAEFKRNCGEPNRRSLRDLATSGAPVGLLAMDGDNPLGWVAVAPRADYPRLARSPVAKTADDITDIWSVTCFFIHRTARRNGVAGRLLDAAVDYAAERGAGIVEAYPVDTSVGKIDSSSLYHGTLDMFLSAGFTITHRNGPRRAMVRKTVG
jgi:GNAT superfamily N-acetyltransferase